MIMDEKREDLEAASAGQSCSRHGLGQQANREAR